MSASPEVVAVHPHLGKALAPGRIRVDCHVHTMWSGDSTTTPGELAAAISVAGVDAVCVTDHSVVTGALALYGELPCQVVVGQEQRTPQGELIGLFLTEAIPAGCRSAREVASAIHAQGGLVYVPHPFDPMRHHLDAATLEELAGDGLVDVVEVRNAKTSLESSNQAATEAAVRLGLSSGAGSDAHVPEAVGAVCVEMAGFEDARGFCSALAHGRVVGHHFDPARAWHTRVVPSTRAGRRALSSS
ncbi:MAG: PHP domain-containing protein [Acidimicrobiales bacterium]